MDTVAHASAELVRIAAQKAAAKEEYKTSLQRIEEKYRDMDVTVVEGGKMEVECVVDDGFDRGVDRGGGYCWCI